MPDPVPSKFSECSAGASALEQLGTSHHEGTPSPLALVSLQQMVPLQLCTYRSWQCWYSLLRVVCDLFDDLAVDLIVQILLLLAQLHPERGKQHQRGDERSEMSPGHPCALPLPASELC